MATAKIKKTKYKNIAQGSRKWDEEEKETGDWEARNQVNRHIQTAEEPLSKPNNCLWEYIIGLAETKWCRQSACIGWENPAIGVLQSLTALF